MEYGPAWVQEPMMTWVLLFVLVVFFLSFAVLAARGFVGNLRSVEDIGTHIRPVNVAALENLLDPGQDAYLARNLNARDLRALRRERALVAMEYVARIAKNSAYFMRAGVLAMRSSDPAMVAAGRQLVNPALQTRLIALRAWTALAFQAMFPGAPQALAFLQNYSELTSGAMTLGRSAQSKAIS